MHIRGEPARVGGAKELSANEDLGQGDIVQVAGTVSTFVGLVQNTRGNDFDQSASGDFGNDQAVIVAATPRLVPVTSQSEQLQVTISALLDNPQEFYGEQVTVNNATIGNQIAAQGGNGAFELGDAGRGRPGPEASARPSAATRPRPSGRAAPRADATCTPAGRRSASEGAIRATHWLGSPTCTCSSSKRKES